MLLDSIKPHNVAPSVAFDAFDHRQLQPQDLSAGGTPGFQLCAQRSSNEATLSHSPRDQANSLAMTRMPYGGSR